MPHRFETEPDCYRRGLGLYVQFTGRDQLEMFPVDFVGGDTLTYGQTETIILKKDADGHVRRCAIQVATTEWMREHVISIPYEPTAVAPKRARKKREA